MSTAEQYLITDRKQPSEFFKKELIHGEFYYADEIFSNIHNYLNYQITYTDITQGKETKGITRQEITEFLAGTGPNMFEYSYDEENNVGGYICNMQGEWTALYGGFFLKEAKLIMALKLAFG